MSSTNLTEHKLKNMSKTIIIQADKKMLNNMICTAVKTGIREEREEDRKEKLANRMMIVPEVCRGLQISRSTLYQWIKLGYLPPLIKIGRRSYMKYSDVQKRIDSASNR